VPELKFEEHIYEVNDFDTVLNTLLKNGHAIPNFCRSGICHSCMMKAEEGTPLAFTQIGLADELVAENYFLTCQCAVYAPMTVRRPDKEKRTRFVAMVREKTSLAEGVVKLTLSPEHEFEYQAGQYTTLINVDGVSADYPIASVHGEGRLMEFHIHNQGKDPLSQYVDEELEVGDGLEIQTALGKNYYSDDLAERNILVVGTDTHIANGLSLIRKALETGHKGNLTLIFGQKSVPPEYWNAVKSSFDEYKNQLSFVDACEVDEGKLVIELESLAKSEAGDKCEIFLAAHSNIAEKLLSHNPEWRTLVVEEV
jgi:2-polyprenylphenol hydroxylase and related flavodoxin oxidoreductases